MSAADSSNILNRLELSHNLRGSLQRAAGYAHQQSHREVTLEHLLLALTEDRDAAVILEASNVDISGLVTEVSDYLGRLEDRVVGEEARQPTLGRDLIHICQSAAAAAQKSQRRAIGSALVLAAIVGEGRSPSAQMLRNHGLTFEQAIQALRQANTAQAARPVPSAPTPSPPPEAGEAPAPEHEVAPHPPGGEQVSEMPAPAAPDLQPRAQGVAAQGEQAREATPGPTSLDPRISGPIRQVQAARDILAGARERVAAAGGAPAKAPQADEAPSPATPASTPLPQPPAEAVTVAPEPDRARQEPPSPAAAPPLPPPRWRHWRGWRRSWPPRPARRSRPSTRS